MKSLSVMLMVMLLVACDNSNSSSEDVEKYVFKKTAEIDLIKDCEENAACIEAVKTQMDACLESSLWRQYVDNSDDGEETIRFVNAFYPCFKDPAGASYF